MVDLALEMAGDDAADDVTEIGLRVDGVQLAGLHERGDDGPVLAAVVGAYAYEGGRVIEAFARA